MAQISDLTELLKHEILDLYSAEEQIIDALPKMIDTASNAQLKKALRDHLKVTELQKKRLDEIKKLMGEEQGESKGFFSKLFGGSGGEKCKGTEGLIKEGEKMMGEDMTTEVMDAAIIGAAQKIEHYEISGYGTAVAYAKELGLTNVSGLLQKTLDEEYEADDSLTKLAVGKLNIEALNGTSASSQSGSKGTVSNAGSSPKKGSSKNAATLKSNNLKSISKTAAPKKSSSANSKYVSKKSGAKSASKSAVKSSSKNSAKGSKPGKNKSSGKR